MNKIKLYASQSAEDCKKFFESFFNRILEMTHMHKLGVNSKNHKSKIILV